MRLKTIRENFLRVDIPSTDMNPMLKILIANAVNQALLQMEMAIQADRVGLLDKARLR